MCPCLIQINLGKLRRCCKGSTEKCACRRTAHQWLHWGSAPHTRSQPCLGKAAQALQQRHLVPGHAGSTVGLRTAFALAMHGAMPTLKVCTQQVCSQLAHCAAAQQLKSADVAGALVLQHSICSDESGQTTRRWSGLDDWLVLVARPGPACIGMVMEAHCQWQAPLSGSCSANTVRQASWGPPGSGPTAPAPCPRLPGPCRPRAASARPPSPAEPRCPGWAGSMP